MRAVRFLTLAMLMVVGIAGTAKAQAYNNTPGTYEVNVGVVPAALPPGSLPSDIAEVGPDLYSGTLTITKTQSGYSVTFRGDRIVGESSDEGKLTINAEFNNNWAGIKLGNLLINGSLEDNVVIGIDGANLISANINGVGTVEGKIQRVIARFGVGAVLENMKVLKAPGNLR